MNKQLIFKGLKWFLGVLSGLVLLITVVLYVFKDDICGIVIKEVNKHLNSTVSVADVDLTFWGSFPNVSVDFNHVFIQDAYKKATVHDTLLYSERIRLKFNPLDLWHEDYKVQAVEIRPGTIQLKVNEKGEVNYNILKPSEEKSESNFKFSLQQVSFEKVRFSYRNRSTHQHYATRVDQLDLKGDFDQKQFTLHAKSNLKVLKAKSGGVTLLSNKHAAFDLNVEVDRLANAVNFPKALVYIENLPFTMKGKVTQEDLNFEVHANNIQLTDLAKNFSVDQVEKVKEFHGSGKVFFDLFIDGKIAAVEPPAIDCAFGIDNGELVLPEQRLKLRKIHVNGAYSNKGGESKEFLALKRLEFTTPGGPFKGNLMITHFKAPNYVGNANGILDLKALHTLFQLPYIDHVNGNLNLQTDFALQSIIQPNEKLDYKINRCNGKVDLNKVTVKMLDDKRVFTDVNGAMYLRGDEAGIHEVAMKVDRTDLRFNGVFKNIIAYFMREGKLNAQVEIDSRYLDVQDLGSTSKEEKIMDGRMFVLPTDIEASVAMNAGTIKYEDHLFKHVIGSIQVKNRILSFPSIQLQNADANIRGSLSIEERSPEIFTITANVASDNIQMKNLFQEWDNFHQDVIKSDNIYGKVQAKMSFEAPFDLRSGIISKAIRSTVYLKINEGRLKNVEAFKSITESLKGNSAKLILGRENIALLESKLLDLKFETLENTFVIENGELKIPQMWVHSNVLDMEISGRHTFENYIDYKFAFRLRNLKQRNTQSEFGIEEDDGTGMRVFMRMYGNLDNPTIVWDKESKKEQAKETRKEEKQQIKSMLKSEFGMFKSDTAVKTFSQKEKPKEVITIDFGNEVKEDPLEKQKIKKDTKLKNTLKGWKEEAEKSKTEGIKLN